MRNASQALATAVRASQCTRAWDSRRRQPHPKRLWKHFSKNDEMGLNNLSCVPARPGARTLFIHGRVSLAAVGAARAARAAAHSKRRAGASILKGCLGKGKREVTTDSARVLGRNSIRPYFTALHFEKAPCSLSAAPPSARPHPRQAARPCSPLRSPRRSRTFSCVPARPHPILLAINSIQGPAGRRCGCDKGGAQRRSRLPATPPPPRREVQRRRPVVAMPTIPVPP